MSFFGQILGELCYRIESANAKPDIVYLQETWLDSDKHTDSSISISGYTLFRKDRKLGKHGGVAFCVKSTLSTNMCCDHDTDGQEVFLDSC
jgi:exonuclease III